MTEQFRSAQLQARRSLVSLLVVLAFLPSSYQALPQQQQRTPTFVMEAPARVELGERIEIRLILDNAHDIAGYETQLLFDTSAAHFSGLHQLDSEIKRFGRDVIPLEVPELPDGIALGLASCPDSNCVEMQEKTQPQGGNGRVLLGTVLIGTDQQGLLELAFEHLKFVDSHGNVISVKTPRTRLSIQVGEQNGVVFRAPASTWQWSRTPPTDEKLDITGEGKVGYADATETAFEWKLGREHGQPCGPANDLSRDVNGDNCIDVIDVQIILANTGEAPPKAPASDPATPGADVPTAEAQSQAAGGSTFTVDSTSDASDSNLGDGICASSAGCTLRAAISEANNRTGADTILFNIPGTGVHTIQLGSRLPSFWDNTGGITIDGYSQPGAQPNTSSQVSNAAIRIQIRGNGPGAFDALLIQSAGNRIQGLAIFNVRRAIWLSGSGAQNNTIAGNFLGTDAAGSFGLTVHTLNASGVQLESGASNNQIGGIAPADRNVLSGNARHGIDFKSQGTANNLVYNNLVGLNPAGTQRLQNMRHGIDINAGASNNIIGGTNSGQRNILSGNGENQNSAFCAGIEISHDTLTTGNQVIGNCIGTDASCNSAPSWSLNRHYGVRLEDGVNNNSIADNVIGNNPQGGIRITGSGTNRNDVYDNRIGISTNGSPIPNGIFGIQVARSAKFNQLGPDNIIANNQFGIQVIDTGTDFHTITRNSIYNNSHLGIDLGPVVGVTSNDIGDGDTGPNEVLNWPLLSSATPAQATGSACSEASVSKPCTIEVFIAERQPSDLGGGNYGQGRTFVGSAITNSNGTFSVPLTGVSVGQYLTATATDADGNTSEFSQNILVSGGGGPFTHAADEFSRTIVDGWGSADVGGNYLLTGTASNFDVNGSGGTMLLPAAGDARIAKLQNVSAQDAEFIFRVRTDKLAQGSNQSVYFIMRAVSSNSEYRAQLRISTSQNVYVRATRVLNGSQTNLGTEVLVPNVTHMAGSYIWIRGEIVGTNPTTIRLTAWADGQVEPGGWQFTVTDSSAILQAPGGIGFRTFITTGVTNAPVLFTFDDLLVTSP